MFSLIIALIAIALVAVLAAASVYYGSDAFQGNKSKARYAEIVNQSEQISSAFLAFKIDGNSLEESGANPCNTGDPSGCLKQLVDANYLSAIPERNETTRKWEVDPDGALFTTTQDVDACILANETKGYIMADESETDANGDGVPDAHVQNGVNDSNGNNINDAVEAGAVCIEQ